MLVNRELLTAGLAIFVLATQVEASNGVQDHGKPPPILTVEHAEILVTENEDDGVEGYLSARIGPDGKPICSGIGQPTETIGDFKGGATAIIGDSQ